MRRQTWSDDYLTAILAVVYIQCVCVRAFVYVQWAFGVTCWEIFTFGRVPYTGIRAMSILNLLKSGERLEKPANTICSDQMYENITVHFTVLFYFW